VLKAAAVARSAKARGAFANLTHAVAAQSGVS
jgi:hypothetical protein